MDKLYRFMLSYTSVFIMAMAIMASGARSSFFICEPKIPEKLRRG